MIGVAGQYSLSVKLGDVDLNLTPTALTQLTIFEYIDKFLPTVYLSFNDTTGTFSHLTQMDSKFNKLSLAFARQDDPQNVKEMQFKIFRRFPKSTQQASAQVEVTGHLNVPNLFSPQYVRGWEGRTIEEVLGSIANTDLSVYEFDVDKGLDTVTNLVQPNYTNAEFFNYLKDRVASRFGDIGYFCFIDTPVTVVQKDIASAYIDQYSVGDQKRRFVFRSLTSFLREKSKFYFSASGDISRTDKNVWPVFKVDVTENNAFFDVMGAGRQEYGYYDYQAGQYRTGVVTADQTGESLTEFYGHDDLESSAGMSRNELGRTTEFMPDYAVLAKSRYIKRLYSLYKIAITTEGMPTIRCGDIVKLAFLQGAVPGTMFSFQHSGFWMVERVIHTFSGTSFSTQLALTRAGIDTQNVTTMAKAEIFKR